MKNGVQGYRYVFYQSSFERLKKSTIRFTTFSDLSGSTPRERADLRTSTFKQKTLRFPTDPWSFLRNVRFPATYVRCALHETQKRVYDRTRGLVCTARARERARGSPEFTFYPKENTVVLSKPVRTDDK